MDKTPIVLVKFADLNLPEKEETEKIGDVLVSELTQEDKDLIQRTGDHSQLVEDAKHPNLKQHPIRFLSDGRGGKIAAVRGHQQGSAVVLLVTMIHSFFLVQAGQQKHPVACQYPLSS